jgi:hypothetical protein
MLETSELREIIDHLQEQWQLHGAPGTTLHQPAARRRRPLVGMDLARLAVVHGLVRHVHETAKAVALLLDHDHVNASIPLVRQMYECALTAVWLVQSREDHGIKALLAEHVRNRKSMQREARKASSQTFREGADDIADTDIDAVAGSFDSVKSFQGLCLDLSPGGTDAYIYYRVLSTYSHASLGVTDLYYSTSTPGGPKETHSLPVARRPLDTSTLSFFTAISMVWGARAFTYISRDQTHRSILRSAGHQLEIDPEIDLSEFYWKRHQAQRRKAASTASQKSPAHNEKAPEPHSEE